MVKKLKKIFLLLMLFAALFLVSFFLFGFVNAATYYVSSNGSSTGSGSINSPWDIQTALNNAVAGDEVLILPGYYSVTGLSSRKSGNLNNYIVFRGSDSNNKPVLNNSAERTLLRIYGNYVMFKDIILINTFRTYNIGIWNNNAPGGRGIILDGIESEWNYPFQAYTVDNIFASNFQDGIIRNSKIKGAGHNGINIQVSQSFTQNSNNFIIENNEIYGQQWHHAINIFPNVVWENPNFIDGFVIRNNYIHDLGNYQSAIFTRYVRNFKIYNNLLVNVGSGLTIASGDATPSDVYDAQGASFDNNIYIGAGGGRAVNNGVANNLRIRNNIFYGFMYQNNIISFSENYVPGIQGYPVQGHILNNNIYYSNTGLMTITWGANTYSDFDLYKSNSGQDSDSYNQNPLFVNPALDWHLLSDSIGINTGQELSYFSTDYVGVSRPQGAAWDIGAFEYVSGSTQYHPADLNQNGCVELGEISVYVGLWLNNQGVSLSEASSAVSIWLGGC